MKSLPDDPPAQIESLTVAIQVPFEPVRTDLLPNALVRCAGRLARKPRAPDRWQKGRRPGLRERGCSPTLVTLTR